MDTAPRRNTRLSLLALLALLLPMTSSAAADPTDKDAKGRRVSYARDVLPILRQHCQGCHQPAKNEGEYVLTDAERMMKPGESKEPPIVPGAPNKSHLLELITPDADGKAEMPSEKPPLSADQVATISKWVAEGAKIDARQDATPPIDAAHPPEYENLPILTALDFSPDGKLLAVSGYHEVLLHRADGNGLVARLVGLSERIESIAFSPDGNRLAVAGGSPARMGEVQIWDTGSRALLLSVIPPGAHDTLYGASWSPDGKLVAFGCADNTVRAIEAATGRQVLYQGAHNDWVLDTAFSLKGTHVISVSRDRSMKLIEVKTERFVDNITSITPGALKGGLTAVDRHPTKEEVLIGGADGIAKTYKIFRTQARKIGDDYNKIRFFDPMPGRIYAAEYSPNGNRIVVGSSDHMSGELRVYDTNNGKLLWKADDLGPTYAAAFSRPDGKTVAAAGQRGKVRLIDTESGTIRGEFVPVAVVAAAAAGQK